MYIYIYIHTIYIYIYIYIQRERERYYTVYIYIYIYRTTGVSTRSRGRQLGLREGSRPPYALSRRVESQDRLRSRRKVHMILGRVKNATTTTTKMSRPKRAVEKLEAPESGPAFPGLDPENQLQPHRGRLFLLFAFDSEESFCGPDGISLRGALEAGGP